MMHVDCSPMKLEAVACAVCHLAVLNVSAVSNTKQADPTPRVPHTHVAQHARAISPLIATVGVRPLHLVCRRCPAQDHQPASGARKIKRDWRVRTARCNQSTATLHNKSDAQ